MKRIHESLQRVFERNRIVFWYDPKGEWLEYFEAFPLASIDKIKIVGNEFGSKIRIVRHQDPEKKFFIYVPSARPTDANNWLLDLLLQGYEYKADKASLALQDVNLPHEFRYLAEEHFVFFQNSKRVQALRELIHKDDQARELRLKMMAVLVGASVVVDDLLLHFLGSYQVQSDMDPAAECFASASLIDYFWKDVARLFSYAPEKPSIRDFSVWVFRAGNPLDNEVVIHPHAKVFLQRWKDSQAHKASFCRWSHQMERELQIASELADISYLPTLSDWDTFEIFEKFTIQRLCRAFDMGAAAADLRATIQKRRTSFWYADHSAGYAAIEHAIELRELLSSADIAIDSTENGLSRYISNWWRIDMAYRLCILNLRRYSQVQVTEQISQWVAKSYVNNFLLPLADRWSDQVRKLNTWECPSLPAQRRFFSKYVLPFRSKGQKVFVIVSDALRFEAAVDFAQRLQSANRWTAEVEALFGSLPTYTQLGMASLLPGGQWALDGNTANVAVNGRSAVGIINRAEILSQACEGKATAIKAEEFLELNSKTDGRALMRDYDVVYIFHDHIDKVGDSASTEAKTFEAVEQAFDELESIIKKVANINGNNMLLTSDHGFLFQQDDVEDGDMTAIPEAESWHYRSRRFALGKGIESNPGVKVFSSTALGVEGDWSAAFPLSLGRFPLQGSGKRFVHGGTSLQEVVVPVIKIHKARTDDIGRVEIELLQVPTKITTGQLAISLFQNKVAGGKVLPRTLRAGLFSKDGKILSEFKTLVFDSKEAEARLRETVVVLALSHAADAFNNSEVELRLDETLPGTNQLVTYKKHILKLQKPFGSDFDEH